MADSRNMPTPPWTSDMNMATPPLTGNGIMDPPPMASEFNMLEPTLTGNEKKPQFPGFGDGIMDTSVLFSGFAPVPKAPKDKSCDKNKISGDNTCKNNLSKGKGKDVVTTKPTTSAIQPTLKLRFSFGKR
ncbi:hypothetical protein ACF0H5_019069 [Mactra antiquata]